MKKSKERVMLFRIIWIAMIIIISTLIARALMVGFNDVLAKNREDKVVTIEIPKGAGLNEIANILEKNEVIREAWFFKIYGFFTGANKKIIPGTFEIKTNLDYDSVVNFLKQNSNRLETDVINVTIPEGKNILEISEILAEKGVCTKEEFISACKAKDFEEKFDFIKEIPNKDQLYYELEGYLFPDTYKFYKDLNPKTVLEKFLYNFRKKINEKGEFAGIDGKTNIKEICKTRGISVDYLINLASLIQAEAADEKDMYMVSSVIQNRLKTTENGGKSKFNEYNMGSLMIDATVWYPYRNKEKVPSDIVASFISRFDTYKNKGLPLGAMCNPGIVAIEAALKPKSTDYYYYCHNKEGKAFYAKTEPEHQVNLKKAGLR